MSKQAESRVADAAYRTLARHDAVLRALIRTYGQPDPFHWTVPAGYTDDRFAALLLHIVSQQISTAVALTMFGRLEARVGREVTPQGVTALGAEGLRGCGLSHAKAAAVLDIAARILNGSIELEQLDSLTDDEVVTSLTAARGIGPWTAQMFLIHQLRRPDVLPAGDLGIRHAVRIAFRQDALPAVDDVTELGRQWSPYRTYAAALLWASLR
jgi:DNA-3-methyladenine glycosylase II